MDTGWRVVGALHQLGEAIYNMRPRLQARGVPSVNQPENS
jgi:hypothetical protein